MASSRTAVSSRSGTKNAVRRKRAGLWSRSEFRIPALLLAPSIFLLLIVIAFPIVQGFYYSVSSGSLMRIGNFVWLDNYIRLLHSPDFYNSLRFSLIFAALSVAGSYSLGLGLALLMQLQIPGQGFFRVMLLLPWIVPSLVSVISWRWLMNDENALFNQLIELFGGSPIYFLSDSNWAVVMVILIKIWRSFPFMMLSLLAALQGIDRTLYEAAAIDGASRWQSFWHVTMPQLRNVSIVLGLLMTIWSVNDFDTPYLLTQGGPANATENLVVLAYRYTFSRNDVGMGSAISFITLFILMILVFFMLRQQRHQ